MAYQATENNALVISVLLQNFRLRSEEMANSPSAERYLKAVRVLSGFLSLSPQNSIELDDRFLADWMIYLWLSGNAFKTAMLYFDIIGSLYNGYAKEGVYPKTSSFGRMKTVLKDFDESVWNKGIDNLMFERAVKTIKSAEHEQGEVRMAIDMIAFSVLNGGMSLMDVAKIRSTEKNDYQRSTVIIDRNKDSRRRYVFNLNQSELTSKQLSLRVQKMILDMLRLRGLPMSDNVMDVVESLYAYAALRCGVSGSDVVSAIGHVPSGLPVLRLCKIHPISDERKKEIADIVARVFISDSPKWYAMRLRPGVTYKDIETRLKLFKDELPKIELFYPYEEIARRTGRKVTFKKKPFITEVIFFKSKVTDILKIFSKIGDLAWCYTKSGKSDGNYAEISQREFDKFQQTIARFTPDYEVSTIGDTPLGANEKVVVVGGLFGGIEGVIKDVQNIPGYESCVYRLEIVGDNGIEWRVGVDPRVVRKKLDKNPVTEKA